MSTFIGIAKTVKFLAEELEPGLNFDQLREDISIIRCAKVMGIPVEMLAWKILYYNDKNKK